MGPWWIGGDFRERGFLQSKMQEMWCKMRDEDCGSGRDGLMLRRRMDEAVKKCSRAISTKVAVMVGCSTRHLARKRGTRDTSNAWDVRR
jgi:hypothetical protein